MKLYLGDSVYADYDGYHVVLTTENGLEVSNTILLEPQVMDELIRFYNFPVKYEKEPGQ
jgi:hypothetical protein